MSDPVYGAGLWQNANVIDGTRCAVAPSMNRRRSSSYPMASALDVEMARRRSSCAAGPSCGFGAARAGDVNNYHSVNRAACARRGELDSLVTLNISFNNSEHILQKQSWAIPAYRAVRVALVRTPDDGGAAALMSEPNCRGELIERSLAMVELDRKKLRECNPTSEDLLDFGSGTGSAEAFGRTRPTWGHFNQFSEISRCSYLGAKFEDFQLAFPVLRSKLPELTLVVQLVLVHRRKHAGDVTVLGQRVFDNLDEVCAPNATNPGVVWGDAAGMPKILQMHTFTEDMATADHVSMAMRFTPVRFPELYNRVFHGLDARMQNQILGAYALPPGFLWGLKDGNYSTQSARMAGRAQAVLEEVQTYHRSLYHTVLALMERGLFDMHIDPEDEDFKRLGSQRRSRRLLLRADSSGSLAAESCTLFTAFRGTTMPRRHVRV